MENPLLASLRGRSLAQAVSQQLREAIISGRLKPGERLREAHLARALGVSQPTVREALKELENEGFVVKRARKGTKVVALDRRDIQKVSEIRALLEPLAFRRAAARIDDRAAARLRQAVEQMADAVRRRDRVGFHHWDMAFHRLVWELSGNEYLERTLSRLLFSLFAFVLSQQEDEQFLDSVRQHEEMLRGLLSRDPEAALQAYWTATRSYWLKHYGVRWSEVPPVSVWRLCE